MFETFIDAAFLEVESFVEFLPRLLFALAIFMVIYGIGKLFSRIVLKILQRSKSPGAYFSFFGKLIKGLAAFLGVVVFLNLIGYNTFAASLVAGGGLTAVMLGFAFKDIGENFLAGFFLAFSRPFGNDDVIETGGITGRVKAIELRHTHLRTAEGCDVFIPSAQLFTKPLHNYTLDGLRRGNFTVGIDYGDNARQALDLLKEATEKTRGVLKKPGVSVQIRGLNPDFVELQVFFWINAKDQERGLSVVRSSAMNNCRLILIENGFTISSDVSASVKLSPVDVLLEKKG